MTLEGKVNLDGICAAVYLDVWCYTEVNSQSTFISKFTNTNKSYTKLSTWWKIQIYTGRVFIWTCSVCIQKWLFHCRRSKKLIHQKKWRFGNSRKRTEAIWGSGFQFLYSFLEKVCSGKSQTKLFLRSSFTQLWAQLYTKPSRFPWDFLGLEMVSWTGLNPLEALSICSELCVKALQTMLSSHRWNPAQLQSGNCCLGKEGV